MGKVCFSGACGFRAGRVVFFDGRGLGFGVMKSRYGECRGFECSYYLRV